MPGELAKGVDPIEGRLAQQLIQESCGRVVTVDENDKIVRRRRVATDDIAVLVIKETTDGGRVVWFRITPNEYRILYHPRYAMIKCDVSSLAISDPSYQPSYTHASPILIERGGDPTLYEYERVQRMEERDWQRTQHQARALDTTFPIHVQWEGIAKTLVGSIREVRVGSKGTMAIELPESLGVCTGEYAYTGHNAGTWGITCPNDLTASGTFRSGKGAHGEGTDNSGRKITYTIQVPG